MNKRIVTIIIALIFFPSLCFARARLQDLTPASISVGATSTLVLAADSDDEREEVILVNDSNEAIYISVGTAAIMNKGIRLNACGGSVTWNYPQVPTEAIYAICTSGTKNLTLTYGQ